MRWRVVRHWANTCHSVNLGSDVISWTFNIETWEDTGLGTDVLGWTLNIKSWMSSKSLSTRLTAKTWMITS